MNCPRCNSKAKVKNGKINSLQRYKCKNCGYNYTVAFKSTAKHNRLKRIALTLYLEGMSSHKIANFLNISHVSVIKWVNKYGGRLHEIRNDAPVKFEKMVQTEPTEGYCIQLVEGKALTQISYSTSNINYDQVDQLSLLRFNY